MQLKKIIENIILFVKNSESLDNSKVTINQNISVGNEKFNRHFTCNSRFEFIVENIRIRSSGAILMIQGFEFYYEINPAQVYYFEKISDFEFLFIEKLGNESYKKSLLLFENITTEKEV